MRHLPLLLSCAALSTALAGCSLQQRTVTGLPPSEVLAQSIQANAQTESVHIDADCEYDISGTIREKGTMVLSGNAVSRFQSFAGSGTITRHIQKPTGANSVHALFDFTVLSSHERYMRFQRIALEPSAGTAGGNAYEQLWWRMPDAHASQAPSVVLQTPDPSAINAILASVIVDRDDGLVTDNRRKMYHYHVHIDAGAPGANSMGLASLPSGELWIDAQTYLLQRAIWNIRNIPGTNGSTDANIDIRLSRHNEQLPVSVPLTYEYATADVWRMFHTILPSALLPE